MDLILVIYHLYFLIQQVLENAGYIPSNTEKYPLGGIVSAIENAFHATPLLVCSKGSVEELHLCFYKDFKVSLFNATENRSCAELNYTKEDFMLFGVSRSDTNRHWPRS